MTTYQHHESKGVAAFSSARWFEAWLHLSTAAELCEDHQALGELKALAKHAYRRALPNKREKKRRKERENRERRAEVERRARHRSGRYLRATGTPPISRQSLTVYLLSDMRAEYAGGSDPLPLHAPSRGAHVA